MNILKKIKLKRLRNEIETFDLEAHCLVSQAIHKKSGYLEWIDSPNGKQDTDFLTADEWRAVNELKKYCLALGEYIMICDDTEKGQNSAVNEWLKDKVLPRWLMFPQYSSCSIAFRMGLEEAENAIFTAEISMSDEEWQEYCNKYPVPDNKTYGVPTDDYRGIIDAIRVRYHVNEARKYKYSK